VAFLLREWLGSASFRFSITTNQRRVSEMKKVVAGMGAVALLAMGTASAGTLEDVKGKGKLSCGVSTGLAGFSQKDEKGGWSGLDVDVCRAVAAAVLGDASKVTYKPLTAKERFTALQSGEIDMLSRNTTWTHTRDGERGQF